MKITSRILLILLTSAAVAGSIYLLVMAGTGNAPDAGGFTDPGGRDSHSRDLHHLATGRTAPPESLTRSARLGGVPSRGHGSRNSFSLGRGIVGIFRSLAVIALITVVVTRMKGRSQKGPHLA